jgi:small subunit ribosomal protein S27e
MRAARPSPPRFLRVRCNDCGNEQVVYSHASSVVKCMVCSKTLAVPRGGQAKIKTMIVGVVE